MEPMWSHIHKQETLRRYFRDGDMSGALDETVSLQNDTEVEMVEAPIAEQAILSSLLPASGET